jgi:hypothetical protein
VEQKAVGHPILERQKQCLPSDPAGNPDREPFPEAEPVEVPVTKHVQRLLWEELKWRRTDRGDHHGPVSCVTACRFSLNRKSNSMT